MRYFLALALLAVPALTSCASMNNAGTASYSIKPFDSVDGVVCCEVEIRNGKEISHLKAHIEKNSKGYIIDLEETGVRAFKGQAIVANAVEGTVSAATDVLGTRAIAGAVTELAPVIGGALAK